jgi:hypothetical protein
MGRWGRLGVTQVTGLPLGRLHHARVILGVHTLDPAIVGAEDDTGEASRGFAVVAHESQRFNGDGVRRSVLDDLRRSVGVGRWLGRHPGPLFGLVRKRSIAVRVPRLPVHHAGKRSVCVYLAHFVLAGDVLQDRGVRRHCPPLHGDGVFPDFDFRLKRGGALGGIVHDTGETACARTRHAAVFGDRRRQARASPFASSCACTGSMTVMCQRP